MGVSMARTRIGGTFGTTAAVTEALARALGPRGRCLDLSRGVRRVLDADPPEATSRHEAHAFAEAYVDEAGDLHLVRDAIGHRSLYWARARSGGVLFASSIHALVATGEVPVELSPLGLALYLSCAYVPGSGTLLQGVWGLRGGEELVFSGRDLGAAPRSRWDWTLPGSPPSFAPEDELCQRLRAELERAVRVRLPPPGAAVGASLSGGIDSSAIVALLARLHDGPLDTYSVWFGPEHAHELEWSRMVAAHVGAPHHVVEVRPEHIASGLDETTRLLEEPNGDPLTVPNTLIFRAASQRSPVLFNGEGGDPCFGGPKNAPMILATLLGDPSGSPAEDYLRAHQRCYDDLEAALMPEVRAQLTPGVLEAQVSPWLEDPRWPGFLDRLMAINVTWKGAHHILPKVDQLSLPAEVWPRSPLFDRALVELAFAIPGTLKRHGADEKYLLKRAVEDLLPRAVIDRPKSGMMVPVEAWFQGPLLSWARERLLEGLPRWGVIRPDFARELVDGRRRGLRPRRGIKLWLLLTLESWLRGLTTR